VKHSIDLHRQHIPRRLLLLDGLGAVLVAVGILELLGLGPQIVPAAVLFPGVGIVLVVIGCLLMLPVPLWLLGRHQERRRHPDEDHDGRARP
jgi:hypothetical protein